MINIEKKTRKREYDKKYREINRDKLLASKRKYYKDHRDERREACKEYYKTNRDNIKKAVREYKKAHHNERVISSRKYYEKHREEMLEYCSEYRRKHPEIDRAHHRRRKALKLSCLGRGIIASQERELFEQYNYHCAYCGEKLPLEIDHIEPLSKGGMDDIENATVSCKSCNSSKSDKILLRFLYDRHQQEME
jgi:5-methylcytosine-specific restriction endonuclease McrA